MNVSLANILKNPLFENARVLAGREGCYRTVKRVSVFDSPFGEDVIGGGIIMPGDFFVTGLLQFADAQSVLAVMRVLVQGESSGVCLISSGRETLISEEVRRFCDQHYFPVVHIGQDISYAQIMDTVNRYIAMENLNVMNQLKLDKITDGKMTAQEKMELLLSMNPNLGEWVQAVYFQGDFASRLLEFEWNARSLASREDVFINTPGAHVMILSAGDEKKMKIHLDVTRRLLSQYFQKPALGVGRAYPRHWVDKALQEGQNALTMALTAGAGEQEYNPLSVLQLLLPLRNSREIQDFYAGFCEKVRGGASEEGSRELLATVRLFVRHAGDFKRTAEALRQHENTVRYRLNRVKALLGLEHDPVAFYETLGLAVRIEQLLGKTDEVVNLSK
ncbi:PucR family transcriptional regulator [Agathobaculum sp.]|uniref:PucR family transcriptional regulator n=1 Tax=Agathobaculum sp. TaxID=2048138 RepID=UPI002A80BBB6|nr:PucR family transcriptional regulator [Agathobaculum sp.]MDY3618305.1 PucR family transcriptional regulator [Agathobaculum sp.]